MLQHQATERLKYVLVQNTGSEQNALPTGETAEWYGINQYFLYTINPCWMGASGRSGCATSTASAWRVRATSRGSTRGTDGVSRRLYEVTLGLNWRRTELGGASEVRWDWFNLDGPLGPTGLPFDGGNEDDQFIFACDAILTF